MVLEKLSAWNQAATTAKEMDLLTSLKPTSYQSWERLSIYIACLESIPTSSQTQAFRFLNNCSSQSFSTQKMNNLHKGQRWPRKPHSSDLIRKFLLYFRQETVFVSEVAFSPCFVLASIKYGMPPCQPKGQLIESLPPILHSLDRRSQIHFVIRKNQGTSAHPKYRLIVTFHVIWAVQNVLHQVWRYQR